jgi:hypothetical protein
MRFADEYFIGTATQDAVMLLRKDSNISRLQGRRYKYFEGLE